MADTSINYTIDQDRVRWPGSGSVITSGSGLTPFGFFDSDSMFQSDAPAAAKWAATRLGYPITDIEMIDLNFYACFEEAVYEYSAQVNQFNIRNNIGILQGTSTNVNLTQTNVAGSGLPQMIKIAQGYGTEFGVGGTIDWKKGSIDAKANQQTYDLQALWGDVSESFDRIEIRRIFHEMPPAAARIYDPFSMTGMSYSNVLNEMGFAGYSPATQFLMTPIFEDLLRMQAIEFNDLVRKSAWSFELINNKLKLFPIPTYNFKMYFQYMLVKERDSQGIYNSGSFYMSGSSTPVTSSVVGDYSNVPYNVIPYGTINSVGKQWIRKYFLALCKEVLGAIRQKYSTIPIPGAEVTLDGAELRQEASAEKTDLITQLRENLEATGRKAQMELRAEEAARLQETLQKVPLGIYIG
jgi:hypothetical protein